MKRNLNQFSNPIDFSHSGFVQKSDKLRCETSFDFSLAVKRQSQQGPPHIAFKAFAECDFRQIDEINKIIKEKQSSLQKNDIQSIEPQTLTKIYRNETFFSLFFEQEPVYNTIQRSLKNGTYSQIITDAAEYQVFLRTLGFILDRPTPVKIQRQNNTKVCDLSILKQCLLFSQENARAAAKIFQIAEQLELYFSNYIDTLDDLALIIEKIPAQHYQALLNKLDENLTTKKIKFAYMPNEGEQSKMKIEVRTSPILISEEFQDAQSKQKDQTDEILRRVNVRDEILRRVNVRILPLAKVLPKQEMFKMIKTHRAKLQGSKLLDAIFQHFWPFEQTQIRLRYLWPFVLCFIVANFYYMQCLFKKD